VDDVHQALLQSLSSVTVPCVTAWVRAQSWLESAQRTLSSFIESIVDTTTVDVVGQTAATVRANTGLTELLKSNSVALYFSPTDAAGAPPAAVDLSILLEHPTAWSLDVVKSNVEGWFSSIPVTVRCSAILY
jgi:hypothetical protein